MSHKGKMQLIFIFVAPPDQVAEGGRIFGSHGPWMEATHRRTGDKALLSYSVSKAPNANQSVHVNRNVHVNRKVNKNRNADVPHQ